MMVRVDIGLALPQYDWEGPVEWAVVVECAQRAEELGFDSVWLADHLFLDPARYGKPAGHAFGYDPIVGITAVARATTRIKLGTLVICPQLRPPAVLAKMLVTVDRVANGRFIAGIGAGWFEPEFRAAGVPFLRPGQRVRQLADAIETMKAMWNHAEGAPPCNPGPFTPGGPPIVVGGKGDKVMEVAVRHADGFNHQGWVHDATSRRFDAFRATCERLGRDPATIPLSACQAVEDWAALPQQLHALEAEGVATVVVTVGAVPFAKATYDVIDRLASAIP